MVVRQAKLEAPTPLPCSGGTSVSCLCNSALEISNRAGGCWTRQRFGPIHPSITRPPVALDPPEYLAWEVPCLPKENADPCGPE